MYLDPGLHHQPLQGLDMVILILIYHHLIRIMLVHVLRLPFICIPLSIHVNTQECLLSIPMNMFSLFHSLINSNLMQVLV